MGIRRDKTQNEILNETAKLIELGCVALKYTLSLGELLVSALKEAESVRTALKQGGRPISTEDLLSALSGADKALAENLRACNIEKFELGKLWLKPENALLRASLLLLRDKLEGFLKKAYGTEFKVRIARPGGRKWAA